MIAFVKDVLSVIAVLVAMLYLDWMLTLIVFAHLSAGGAAGRQHRQAAALGGAAHPEPSSAT